jgi:hypothetical protein
MPWRGRRAQQLSRHRILFLLVLKLKAMVLEDLPHATSLLERGSMGKLALLASRFMRTHTPSPWFSPST